MEHNYYEILGVSKTATPEEIRKAYRNKMKQYHPDIHQDDATYTEKAQLINEAYATLKDPTKRKQYDSKIKSSTTYKTYQKNSGTTSKTASYTQNNNNNKSSGYTSSSTTSNKSNKSQADILKDDYFKKAITFLKKLESSTFTNDILSVNEKYLEYINSKEKYENYLYYNLKFKERLKQILKDLFISWDVFGNRDMLFIKNELLTMLKKILKNSILEDTSFLLELYMQLAKTYNAQFLINSYEYVVKKLFETESVLKDFDDILNSNPYDFNNNKKNKKL